MSKKNNYKTVLILSHLLLMFFISCNNSAPSITTSEKHYITIDSTINRSKATELIIEPYRNSIEKKMNQIIGYSDRDMNKGRPESLLTNLIADMMLAEGIDIANERNSPTPDISIINVKGLRSPIKRGSITVSSIFRLMPFENKLVLLTLSGKQVKLLFTHLAEMGGEGISGASFGIKTNKPFDININGKPLKDEQSYTIVTADYLANGGDNYALLPTIKERYNSEVKIRDVIISRIRRLTNEGKYINSTLDKRIFYAN